MTIGDAIEMLKEVGNNDLQLVIPSEFGFVSACATDSGVATDEKGEKVFVLLPCFCNLPDDALTIEVKADHFDVIEN